MKQSFKQCVFLSAGAKGLVWQLPLSFLPLACVVRRFSAVLP